jgi:hypothetical protein
VGYVRGYDAPAVVDAGQIVLAAEISGSPVDRAQLGPMVTAASASGRPTNLARESRVVVRGLVFLVGSTSLLPRHSGWSASWRQLAIT